MVNVPEQKSTGAADNLQDVGMSRMSRSSSRAVQHESRGRRISLRRILVHNSHIQAGLPAGRCRVCSEGLEGILANAPRDRVSEPVVVESSGTDEEGSAAPPSGNASQLVAAELLRRGGP